jgi:hypothetical protein
VPAGTLRPRLRHSKYPDFREEPKTERVLWSALAYGLSDKAEEILGSASSCSSGVRTS